MHQRNKPSVHGLVGIVLNATRAVGWFIIRVIVCGFEAVVKLAPQPFLELKGALDVGLGALLVLEFGVVVGELVEEDGDGHAVEDDAKGDAAERHAAAQVGDGHHVPVAHSGDAHLQGGGREIVLS